MLLGKKVGEGLGSVCRKLEVKVWQERRMLMDPEPWAITLSPGQQKGDF